MILFSVICIILTRYFETMYGGLPIVDNNALVRYFFSSSSNFKVRHNLGGMQSHEYTDA